METNVNYAISFCKRGGLNHRKHCIDFNYFHGRIIEQGRHHELMKKGGEYYRLVRVQI
ncbi:hypothetical protein ACE1TI_04880 [Alteribacillus sp. JSM 102045]|uniref:hypothetical protein n=1 Tax=Alteribacillus sp. JSM 102045 TaxID=1562101 RepID=UPI0035C23CBF